jgi:hypothetical protein
MEKTNQTNETCSMNSVNFVHILYETMINCRNSFSNATGLQISYNFDNGSRNFPFTNLSSIIPLKQLTRLVIIFFNINFSKIIEALRCTPNVHTFTINFVQCCHKNLALSQQSENFRLVSKTNNIKEMTIKSNNNTSKVVTFFMNLCPRLQHLTIDNLLDIMKKTYGFYCQHIIIALCQFDQNVTCENGGQCIATDKHMVSNKQFICIFSQGFSRKRCEKADSKIMIFFHKDIILPQSILFHFIQMIHNGPPENGST